MRAQVGKSNAVCREVCKQQRAEAEKCAKRCKFNLASRSNEAPSFPFPSNLSFLNENTAKGFSSVEELKYDLEQGAWHYLNEVVEENLNAPKCDARIRTQAQPKANAGGATDYGTNNQEEGIEEGDLAVSDGEIRKYYL